MIGFREKVVLVTGASRGIGAATALAFAQAGAKAVVVHYQSRLREAQMVAEAVKEAGAEPLLWAANLEDQSAVEELFVGCLARLGRMDIVVANAGIWPPDSSPLDQIPLDRWSRTMRVNLDGMFFVCREAGRALTEGPERGLDKSLITLSSTAGQRGEAGHADYAASKGAVISLTKSLAIELAPRGVRVNCVAPGWVETEMSATALQADPGERDAILKTIPLARVATPQDVAGPILFLASPLARHVTGEILNVNGGAVLCG
jgi:3-oxoacyl-[acyl-carrier protein] reductase